MEERIYTSNELAGMFGCTRIAVLKWAAKSGVRYAGEGKRKTYLFTRADINRFRDRPKPGRRWARKEEGPPGPKIPGTLS